MHDARAHELIVTGGSGGLPLCTTELYDLHADRWTPLTGRLLLAMECRAVPLGNKTVLVVQADSHSHTISQVVDLRERCSTLLVVASPLQSRARHALASIGENTAALLGGYASTCVELYDAAANCWALRENWQLPVVTTRHCATVVQV